MIQRCHLNRLNQFATFLVPHIRNSRTNPHILALLSGLDEVVTSGLSLPREDEEWAYKAGIRLKVTI
jgi:hypothetical protein